MTRTCMLGVSKIGPYTSDNPVLESYSESCLRSLGPSVIRHRVRIQFVGHLVHDAVDVGAVFGQYVQGTRNGPEIAARNGTERNGLERHDGRFTPSRTGRGRTTSMAHGSRSRVGTMSSGVCSGPRGKGTDARRGRGRVRRAYDGCMHVPRPWCKIRMSAFTQVSRDDKVI